MARHAVLRLYEAPTPEVRYFPVFAGREDSTDRAEALFHFGALGSSGAVTVSAVESDSVALPKASDSS
jgi:hypothetical protein